MKLNIEFIDKFMTFFTPKFAYPQKYKYMYIDKVYDQIRLIFFKCIKLKENFHEINVIKQRR